MTKEQEILAEAIIEKHQKEQGLLDWTNYYYECDTYLVKYSAAEKIPNLRID